MVSRSTNAFNDPSNNMNKLLKLFTCYSFAESRQQKGDWWWWFSLGYSLVRLEREAICGRGSPVSGELVEMLEGFWVDTCSKSKVEED